MASVIVTPTARRNLQRLVDTHSLPASTAARLATSIAPVGLFPLIGAQLAGRWAGFRFVLGPWRWMIVVYRYDAGNDQVAIVTIQDGRQARAATHER